MGRYQLTVVQSLPLPRISTLCRFKTGAVGAEILRFFYPAHPVVSYRTRRNLGELWNAGYLRRYSLSPSAFLVRSD